MTSQRVAEDPNNLVETNKSACPPLSETPMFSLLTDLDEPSKILDDSTLTTTEPSDNDSIDEQLSESSPSIHSIPSDDIEEASHNDREQHPRKKSVRFSAVSVREYTVIEESDATASDDSDESQMPARTLSWEYSQQTTRDIESHQREVEKEKAANYAMMISEHIRRVQEKEAADAALKKSKKSKGIKGKMKKLIKDIGRGFVIGSSSSQFMY